MMSHGLKLSLERLTEGRGWTIQLTLSQLIQTLVLLVALASAWVRARNAIQQNLIEVRDTHIAVMRIEDVQAKNASQLAEQAQAIEALQRKVERLKIVRVQPPPRRGRPEYVQPPIYVRGGE